MVESEVLVGNRLGLHARAAAKLVRAASEFSSRVMVTNIARTEEANAKSILSVLALAASAGTRLVLICEGDDEFEASRVITALFEEKFGED